MTIFAILFFPTALGDCYRTRRSPETRIDSNSVLRRRCGCQRKPALGPDAAHDLCLASTASSALIELRASGVDDAMKVGISLTTNHPDTKDPRQAARWMVERAAAARHAGL